MNVYQLSAKNCMSHLLLKDTFDTFLFIEGEFTTFNKFTISGYSPGRLLRRKTGRDLLPLGKDP